MESYGQPGLLWTLMIRYTLQTTRTLTRNVGISQSIALARAILFRVLQTKLTGQQH